MWVSPLPDRNTAAASAAELPGDTPDAGYICRLCSIVIISLSLIVSPSVYLMYNVRD
jgi:hypothetical protein